MKIGITADCSSCLEYAPFENNIKLTRTTIHFGDEHLVDGIDIKAEEFYQKLKETDIIPSTSAPTPEEIATRANELKAEGCTDVIHFPISFGLSKYGENLMMNADSYIEGINMHVFDCRTACIMEGYHAFYAQILADSGYGVDEIFTEVRKLSDNSMTYFVVDDLKYLIKNGRLNVVSGTIGSLLMIKPILILGREGGTIDPFEKVRTYNKAIARVIEVVGEAIQNKKEVILLAQYTTNIEQANDIIKMCKERFDNVVAYKTSIVTPTVGAHIGCGVVGLSYIILDDLKEKEQLKNR